MEIIIGVVLAAVVFIIISSWWSEGYIEAGEGMVIFAVFGGLMFGLFAAKTPAAKALILVPLTAAAIWGAYLVKAGSMNSYLKEMIRQYTQTIDQDPRNFAARVKLAQALYELGERERAIVEMKMAIDLTPGAAYKERQELKTWEADERLKQTGFVTCTLCAMRNERGRAKCIKCGTALPYSTPKKSKKESRRAFVVIITGLALATASFALFPPKLAVFPAGCGIFAAVVWWGLLKSS